jgi:biotin carboxylase
MLVLFVAPYFSENAKLYLDRTASVPGVRVAVITQDDAATLPLELRARFVGVARVADALRADDIVTVARELPASLGPIHRLLGIVEQLQVPLAEARERLGVDGMRAEQAHCFRDKTRMKELLRAAGLPVARFRLVDNTEDAKRFAAEVGGHLVVKPPAGAAAQTTYRVHDEASLREALGPTSAAAGGVALLEELVTGEEHSFDAFVQRGRVVFYSVSDYRPSCLEVMQHPWMQWVVVLPREHEADDIAQAGARALEVLGLENGMCHLEWFRRADGSLVISEVGARPPGAQIPTLISRAHDVDCHGAWARLMAAGTFEPFPPRKYASGAAYLRGQGQGRVRAVHGIEQLQRDLGDLVTDARLPQHGQEKAPSYEGEGFILVRHPETKVVEDALTHIISTVRVELG